MHACVGGSNIGEARMHRTAVFVDRDGTICYDRHYISDPDQIELIPHVVQGLLRLEQHGMPLIIVTNQSGIGRGYFDERVLEIVHSRLSGKLLSRGIHIDDIFYCPHRPDDGCDCRKPSPGMLLMAAEKHRINLHESFVIGDRMMDIEMAHAAGASGVLIPEPGDQYEVNREILASKEKPDYIARNMVDAADWILTMVAHIRGTHDEAR